MQLGVAEDLDFFDSEEVSVAVEPEPRSATSAAEDCDCSDARAVEEIRVEIHPEAESVDSFEVEVSDVADGGEKFRLAAPMEWEAAFLPSSMERVKFALTTANEEVFSASHEDRCPPSSSAQQRSFRMWQV